MKDKREGAVQETLASRICTASNLGPAATATFSTSNWPEGTADLADRAHRLRPPPGWTPSGIHHKTSRFLSEELEQRPLPAASAVLKPVQEARLRALVAEHHGAIWRLLRRLGVPTAELEDGVLEVFWVASRRLPDIELGSERSFLYQTALRVAGHARRSQRRRREVLVPEEDLAIHVDVGALPDEIADRKRLRVLLDRVLDAMPEDLRTVFVLFELEELSGPEIAEWLMIPEGTVKSRLRRAREEFERVLARCAPRTRK
ncbi:RNA polymerase sigma factor [Sorangium cellulosum]|uniref:RNA polymerase sigma factor n=1 Tax=Sorangium cellulosum TaxID=56 RepID=UPI0004246704|nr:sigma-70 family RNA polymerase sigma factor [Sorangium cellulosum]